MDLFEWSYIRSVNVTNHPFCCLGWSFLTFTRCIQALQLIWKLRFGLHTDFAFYRWTLQAREFLLQQLPSTYTFWRIEPFKGLSLQQDLTINFFYSSSVLYFSMPLKVLRVSLWIFLMPRFHFLWENPTRSAHNITYVVIVKLVIWVPLLVWSRTTKVVLTYIYMNLILNN